MNIKLLLFLSLFSTALGAQPTLLRSNYFAIGDSTIIYNKFDTSLASISTGASGANVTWDFSMVDFNHSSVMVDTLLYIDPAGTPFFPSTMGADYSQANLCYMILTDDFNPHDSDFNYCYADNDSVSFIGHWADGGEVKFGKIIVMIL